MAFSSGETLIFSGTLGNKHLYVWEVTGDGSDVTLDSGLACCDEAWVQAITDAGVSRGVRVASISSGVVTLSHAPRNTLTNWIFCLGS